MLGQPHEVGDGHARCLVDQLEAGRHVFTRHPLARELLEHAVHDAVAEAAHLLGAVDPLEPRVRRDEEVAVSRVADDVGERAPVDEVDSTWGVDVDDGDVRYVRRRGRYGGGGVGRVVYQRRRVIVHVVEWLVAVKRRRPVEDCRRVVLAACGHRRLHGEG